MQIKKRLAFSTLGCPNWRFERITEQAAAIGLVGIELRGIGAALDVREIPCLLPENRPKTRAFLQKAGIVLCCLGTSAAFHDQEKRADALAEGVAALSVARAMDIPAIRVFGNDISHGSDRSAVLDGVADGILHLCDAAAKIGGARVLLEVHGDFNTADSLSALLARIDGHPYFGILWDILHSYRAVGNDFLPFYQTIRRYVRHVHIKDGRADVSGGVLLTLPGYGDIDIGAIVRTLEADGYTGWYSFEWEKRWHPSLDAPEIAFPAYATYMRAL